MQFNSEANNQDLCTLADRLVKTSVSSFPLVDKVLYANQGSRQILSWIFSAYGGWIYDDGNYTDFPEALTNIVSNQSDYTLPTGAEYVRSVSVKDEAGNWDQLTPITLEQIKQQEDEAEFEETDGPPQYYRIIGQSIKIYPASNYSQDESLSVHFSRDISSFSVDATTKTPGFDFRFHEAVAVFMALQYAKINRLDVKTDLQKDWDGNEDVTGREGGYKLRIKKHYSRKFAEMFPPRIIARDTWRDNT